MTKDDERAAEKTVNPVAEDNRDINEKERLAIGSGQFNLAL